MYMVYDLLGEVVKIRRSSDPERLFNEHDVKRLTDCGFGRADLVEGVISLTLNPGVAYRDIAERLALDVQRVVGGGSERLWYTVDVPSREPEEYCVEPDGTVWCSRTSSGHIFDGPDDDVGHLPEV